MCPSLTEKYRPKSFDEVKGQDEILGLIKNAISRAEKPHMLFIGKSGTGKTSVAHIIAKKLGIPIRELNASDERGIDTVRGFVKRVSRIRGNRILLLDEVDNMTGDAQQALRRIMEKTKGTMFILSGNREWKIIDPIKSRCAIFRFKRLKDEVVLRRLLEVCRDEGIKITQGSHEGFLAIVHDARGDLRRALNNLEKIIGAGKEISAKEVIALQKPKIAGEALRVAVNGDFERAKEMLEDSYINAQFNVDDVLDEVYEAIGGLKSDVKVKARLYRELKSVDANCRVGGNPLIQMIGFISFSWIAPHLSSECPILKEVK